MSHLQYTAKSHHLQWNMKHIIQNLSSALSGLLP